MSSLAVLSRVLPLAVVVVALGSPVRAQDTALPAVQQAGSATREEKNVSMSEGVYRRLTAVHDLLAGDKADEALERLEQLAAVRLTSYERALVQQAFGFCYAHEERYPEAIEAFERSLALDALPNDAQQGMLYSLAGLYASQERYEKAISTMHTWFTYAEEPVPADAYMLVGSSYAQLEKPRNALPYVREANGRAAKPNESWQTLELSIDFELKDYRSAAELLRRMVVYWPGNTQYWEMLSSAYLELDDDRNALATLMIAYRKGLIHEQAKLLNLIRLNMFLELPYEAGRMLEKGIAEREIEASRKNLELLLSAWTDARELDKAIEVIDRLAPLAPDGRYYLQKAQLLAERADWPRVVDAADRAIDRGGLDRPGTAYLLKGMGYAELGRFEDALGAFAEARKADDTARRNADAWISYVRDRQRFAQAQR